VEGCRDDPNQLVVGGAINRWRQETNENRVSTHAGKAGPSRPRDDPDRELDTVGRRLNRRHCFQRHLDGVVSVAPNLDGLAPKRRPLHGGDDAVGQMAWYRDERIGVGNLNRSNGAGGHSRLSGNRAH
jgi:hypothetical protein